MNLTAGLQVLDWHQTGVRMEMPAMIRRHDSGTNLAMSSKADSVSNSPPSRCCKAECRLRGDKFYLLRSVFQLFHLSKPRS